MKRLTFLIFMAMVFAVKPEDNRAGLGAYYKLSKYEGRENRLYPLLNLKYNDFYLQGSEIGYNICGKDTGVSVFLKKDTTEGFEKGELEGVNALLDRRENPVFAGVRLSKKTGNLNLELSGYRDFTSDGNNAKLKASYAYEVFRFLYFLPSVSAIYSDKNYTRYFYGITCQEAVLTGNPYKDLNGSVRGEMELGGALFFSTKAGIYFSYNLEILNPDEYNDSLIKNSVNKSFVLLGIYRF